jgi:hypothetical protein
MFIPLKVTTNGFDPLHAHMLHGAGIFSNIYPKNHSKCIGKYTIHGAYGI